MEKINNLLNNNNKFIIKIQKKVIISYNQKKFHIQIVYIVINKLNYQMLQD